MMPIAKTAKKAAKSRQSAGLASQPQIRVPSTLSQGASPILAMTTGSLQNDANLRVTAPVVSAAVWPSRLGRSAML